MSDFPTRVDAFLTEFFRLNPTFATAIGEHAHDDRWPDLTAAGRAERLAFAERKLAKIFSIGEQQIEGEEDEIAGLAIGNRRLQRGKIRQALGIDGDNLAIDQRIG